MLRGVLALAMILVGLAGCTPSVIGTYKDPQYSEKINKAWVVLLSTHVPSASNGQRRSGSAQKSLDALNSAMMARLPDLAAQSGLYSALVISGDPDFAKSGYRNLKDEGGKTARHILVIRPNLINSHCGALACRSVITATTTVIDGRLEKVVWQVSTEIPEMSGLSTFSNADVDAYWALVISQLKKDGLL
jgi:hypothetical protein